MAYPTLRTTTPHPDPGLTHTTAISDLAGLQNMSLNLAGNYYLTGNIDASALPFTPVGTMADSFVGTFDGCGYTITGLNMSRPANTHNGLFGFVRDGAKIANVTLAAVIITCGDYSGALVGYALESGGGEILIQNCHSSGTMTGSVNASTSVGGLIGTVSNDNAAGIIHVYDCSSSCAVTLLSNFASWSGGLIGCCDGATVSNCFATGNVDASDEGNLIGGLIGSLAIPPEGVHNIITYCYATGNISGEIQLGGLLGNSITGDIIQKCYATGNVTSSGVSTVATGAGGFIGQAAGSITDCFALGDVSSDIALVEVGGFCGLCKTSGTVFTNCFSVGSATGLSGPGGFIGDSLPDTQFISCYWDYEASGNLTSDGGEPRTTRQMGKRGTFVGYNFNLVWYLPVTAKQLIMGRPRVGYPIRALHTVHRNVYG